MDSNLIIIYSKRSKKKKNSFQDWDLISIKIVSSRVENENENVRIVISAEMKFLFCTFSLIFSSFVTSNFSQTIVNVLNSYFLLLVGSSYGLWCCDVRWSLSLCVRALGKSGHVARQYFPYVSSESDLQRYKAIPFRQNSTNVNSDQHGSSTLSNVPSEYRSDRVKVSFSIEHFFLHSIKYYRNKTNIRRIDCFNIFATG